MRNWLALGYSFGYVFLVLALAEIVGRKIKNKQISRKIIHILCGNWIVIAFTCFDSLWAAVIPPISFIFINYMSYRKDLFQAMEGKKSMGTVYYAISLLVLTVSGWLLKFPAMAYTGILSMAYGDGLAAVLGEKFGSWKWDSKRDSKSYIGSAAVFVLSAAAALLVSIFFDLPQALPIALLCGAFALYVELYGHNGCDNLSLPIGTATLYYYFHILRIRGEQNEFWLIAGITLIILVAALSRDSITENGAGVAFLVGILVFAGGGFGLYGGLILFFIIGSVTSKFKKQKKKDSEKLQQRTGARSWVQVLANSAAIIAVLWLGQLSNEQRVAFLSAFSVLAAAAADTVSSDLGMLTRGKTFSILTGKPVTKGLSGGVSVKGLVSGFLAAVALALPLMVRYHWREVLAVIGCGFLGTIVDSILGDRLQVKYQAEDGTLTEVRLAGDGRERPRIRGFRWINNDAVNLITLFFVALVSFWLFTEIL